MRISDWSSDVCSSDLALQWRRKTATAQEGLAQVRQVAALCRELGLTCIVNDDWRLAALIDTDGVHLGREDGSLAQARLALGSEKIIGVSCYKDTALAAQAQKAAVKYIAFCAKSRSSGKPNPIRTKPEPIAIRKHTCQENK